MIFDNSRDIYVELSSITFGEGSDAEESPRRLAKEREDNELACSFASICLFISLLQRKPQITKTNTSSAAPLTEAIVGANVDVAFVSMCAKSDNKKERDVTS